MADAPAAQAPAGVGQPAAGQRAAVLPPFVAARDVWSFDQRTPMRLVEREAAVARFMDGPARASGLHILLNAGWQDREVKPLEALEKVFTEATLDELVQMCDAELAEQGLRALSSSDELRIFIGSYLRAMAYSLTEVTYEGFRVKMSLQKEDGAHVLMMPYERFLEIKSCLRMSHGRAWHHGAPDAAGTSAAFRKALRRPMEEGNQFLSNAFAATRSVVCRDNSLHITVDDNSVPWSGAGVPGKAHGVRKTRSDGFPSDCAAEVCFGFLLSQQYVAHFRIISIPCANT